MAVSVAFYLMAKLVIIGAISVKYLGI